MDYEKKYKEALERAKKYKMQCDLIITQDIFPELKESEDELTWLTKYIEEEAYSLSIDIRDDEDRIKLKKLQKALAWLEKQGTSYTNRDVDDAYLKGISDAKNEFEKQYEANYQIRKDIGTFIFNHSSVKDRAKWMDYLGIKVSLVEKQGEQKPITSLDMEPEVLDKVVNDCIFGNEKSAWSEEDEKRVKETLAIIETLEDINKAKDGFLCTKMWLKSLKDRVLPQSGYNPYKEVVESIAEMCKHYDKASHSALRDFYDNVKVKCRDAKEYDSLFPQNTWKPSNKQIKVCKEVYADTLSAKGFGLDTVNSEINRLEEQLKNL